MSNNIKYDREDVINKATNLYWRKGFHGTSMRNLQDVVDMRPGSIYATFGSKEGLYKEAIQHYANVGELHLAACVQEVASPLNALKKFMKDVVIGSYKTAPSGLCMLVKTVSELTEENAELLAEAKRLLHGMEKCFAGVIAQAQACGELDKSKDTAELARYIQIQIMGLRIYMRANNGDLVIDKLIDDMFERGIV